MGRGADGDVDTCFGVEPLGEPLGVEGQDAESGGGPAHEGPAIATRSSAPADGGAGGVSVARMDLGLAGRRAVVTGASSGIGLAVARALHAEGTQVAMLARSADRLRAAAAGIGTPFVADTADDASVHAAVAAVTDAFGGVDVLVNSAARATPPGGVPAPLEVTDDDVRVEIEVKVLGYLRTARAVAPLMTARAGAGSST